MGTKEVADCLVQERNGVQEARRRGGEEGERMADQYSKKVKGSVKGSMIFYFKHLLFCDVNYLFLPHVSVKLAVHTNYL